MQLCSPQTGPLLKAGFRVIAPDLRGALGGQSDAPQEVEGYGITNSIVKDVAGEICLDVQPSFHHHVLQASTMQP